MIVRLFLLFTLVPLIELFFMIKIGSHIGALNTVILLLATGLIGAALARSQGLKAMRQISDALARGQIPAEELIDGLLIFVAGVLLVTPGVLTDMAAVLLLIPNTRTLFKRWLRKKFDRMVASGRAGRYFP